MKLRRIKTVEIKPTAPFSFDPTFHKPDHFTSGDNYWEPGVRWQTWAWSGRCLGLKFLNRGTLNDPRVEIDVYADRRLNDTLIASLVEEIQYRYNLQLD